MRSEALSLNPVVPRHGSRLFPKVLKWSGIVFGGLLVLIIVLGIAAAGTPELGDPEYIERQRACSEINLHEFGGATLENLEKLGFVEKWDALPPEDEMRDIRQQCKEAGYEWVDNWIDFGERRAILAPGETNTAVTGAIQETFRVINGCEIKPGTVCHRADLRGVDLRNADLEGAW